MTYYYQIQPKEFSQLFLPFSRNAASIEKWLSFSLTKEQSENIAIYFNAKPRLNYRLPSSTETQKTPKELFIQKTQNFLESTFSFYDNFSIYIPTANKNKDYNFAAAFEEGLLKIKQDILTLPVSDIEKNQLFDHYLLNTVAYLAVSALRKKPVVLSLDTEIHAATATPFLQKLEEKNIMAYVPAQTTPLTTGQIFYHPLAQYQEHLAQQEKLQELQGENFNWDIDEGFLLRSWGHSDYVLEQFANSFIALSQAEPQVFEEPDFWSKASEVFWTKISSYQLKQWGTNKFELPQEAFKDFQSTEQVQKFLTQIFSRPEVLDKLTENSNYGLLFALMRNSSDAWAKGFRISSTFITPLLTHHLNQTEFLKVVSEGIFLNDYYKLLSPATIHKPEVQNILIDNLRFDKEYPTNNLMDLFLKHLPVSSINYTFFLNYFQHMGPGNTMRSYIHDPEKLITSAFKNLTDTEFTELLKLQPEFCIDKYKSAYSQEQRAAKDDSFFEPIFSLALQEKQKVRAELMGFLREHKQFNRFFNKDENQLRAIEAQNYHIQGLTKERMSFLERHEDILLKALSVNCEFIKDSLWPLKYYDNNKFLKLMSPTFLMKVAYDNSSVKMALKNFANKPEAEQQEMVKHNALFYYFASEKIKLDREKAAHYFGALLGLKEQPSFSLQFREQDIPQQFFKDHEFCALLVKNYGATYPKKIASVIEPKLWFNQKFILNLCEAIDERKNIALIEFLPAPAKKFFASFSLEAGNYTEFMKNYFVRVNLNQELAERTAPPPQTKRHKI